MYTPYAPRHSVISVHEYEGPNELSDYLIYLAHNDTAYIEYSNWKNDPRDEFIAMIDVSIKHSICRKVEFVFF